MSDLPIHEDSRVVAMANCMLFALQAWKNKPIYDQSTKKMEGWHQWFKRTLQEAGFDIVNIDEIARKR